MGVRSALSTLLLLELLLAADEARAASPLVRWVPRPLLRDTAFSMALWQWIALPVGLAIAAVLGVVLARLTLAALGRLARGTSSQWDDVVLDRSRGPLRLLFTMLAARALVPLLSLPEGPEDVAARVLTATASAALFWALFRTADILADALAATTWAERTAAARTLIPLGNRMSKVVIGALAIGTALSLLGVPVVSIIAGLGVGGLAIALAAQKTFENLLGAFTIGADQPLREGDFVRIDDFLGTVERIGLRSTQIRTLDRTVVTLPNGQLAEKRIESFAQRDRIRLHAILGMVYGTSEAQMREVMRGLEAVMRGHPKILPDLVLVRFIGFGASSLDIEVMCWFMTTNFDEFCAIRTEVNLAFMRVIAEAGTSFAFPSQSLYVERVPSALSARAP